MSRRRIAEPLGRFADGLKKAKTTIDYAAVLYALLEELDVPRQLEAWAKQAEEAGDLAQAAEHLQIWKQVVGLLDQLAAIGGDEAIGRREFVQLVESGLEAMEFSLVPQGLDHVTIGRIEQNTAADMPIVFLLGIEEGVLPKRASEEGLLSEADRARLAEQGIRLAPGMIANNMDEQFLAYQVLTAPSKRLIVSYALADEEGKGLRPSSLVVRLAKFAGIKIEPILLEHVPLVHPRQAFRRLTDALRTVRAGEENRADWQTIYEWARREDRLRPQLMRRLDGLFRKNTAQSLSGAAASRLYLKERRLYGSVTRFESFRACPFKHFVQYGLRLKERDIFRLRPPDLGLFFHAALKVFGEKVEEEKGWGALTQADSAAMVKEITELLVPRLQNEILLSNARRQALVGRLETTLRKAVERLCDFGRTSSFLPYAYEQSFGYGEGALSPLKWHLSGGERLEIIGQIDRVDRLTKDGKDYFLVVDYKSGGAWLTMADVYYGLRLQLLTYLLALEASGQAAIPAGVLYYFVKQPFITAEQKMSEEAVWEEICKARRMPGWLLADKNILQELENTFDKRSDFFKISLKKDGEFASASLPYLKTQEEFDKLTAYVGEMLRATGAAILGGEIALRPVSLKDRKACTYCAYRDVCQFDETLAENQVTVLPEMDEAEVFKKIEEQEGRAWPGRTNN